ncbi:BMC_2a_G0050430.mRNA.1.CDS.1 [Saccharomyces cerevisiae]|nr:Ade2p [Saccharomyces cerevisiae YJM1447]CAI4714805.1 BMC_2a_G0050430.mRNA.1.CDS.1 [Saccharomyces cerevisiae]CAI4722122.1 BMB_G0050390.mRNA.1.CDS.1 [Saccharomyces cerevisiae]CAI7300345.1 BMC_2a_G0050430.mRNA.1.CDS.1 [Saccharomyces cerevisiae]CAI7303183.1 BMB_G0050390.mRNA.1.CDS.1 [Saccharomyces cerevisiae]
MDSRTVGILGGGQLGRMIVEAANRLNIKTVILDAENSPAKQISNSNDHVNGSFSNPLDIEKLAEKCDVLTIEIEHVDVPTLKNLQVKHPKLKIYPSPETIGLIQDKYIQKEHLIKNGIAVTQSVPVEQASETSLLNVGRDLGFPFVLKSRTLAYDGRGNFVVKNKEMIPEALEVLKDRPLYAEKWAPFTKELAVMIVRSVNGLVFSYPIVETIHKDNICDLCYAPARVPDSVQLKAKLLAENAIKSFPGCGIFGVEMFYLETGELLINEIAPRPHNSGHYTIDACVTSQFEAHLRSILDLPMPKNFTSFSTITTNAIMLNVLGDKHTKDKELETCKRALATPGSSVYLYGKESRPNRKVGHINIIASSMAECEQRLNYITGRTDIPIKISVAQKLDLEAMVKPLVGIIMGSDSDLPVMSAACAVLKDFGVPFEVTIVSAHRTPHRMSAYAISASKRGIKTIIAGAGGAAHLPGMVAAMTPLPVIGVPVKGSCLDGVDSLHSIVQMPRGVPVATVAINNSTNAALLAVRLLGAYDSSYTTKMEQFLLKQEEEVLVKAQKLETVGYEAYLENK